MLTDQAAQHLLQAHRHARLALDEMLPEHIRTRRREIRRQAKSLLRLLLIDDAEPTASDEPPARATRVTIE